MKLLCLVEKDQLHIFWDYLLVVNVLLCSDLLPRMTFLFFTRDLVVSYLINILYIADMNQEIEISNLEVSDETEICTAESLVSGPSHFEFEECHLLGCYAM
jgi:hypothetical protein